MQTVLIVIHLLIVLGLVGVVLIQRSEGGGLGIGGGSGFMSARGTANVLTRTTAILATLFFITSLGLTLLSHYQGRPTDILDRIPSTEGKGNGILDSLGPQPGAAPAGGQAPASPVPSTSAPAASAPAAPATSAPSNGAPAQPAAPAQPSSGGGNSGVPTGQ